MPWEFPSKEVHEDIAQALQVVPSTLFDAQVGVDGGIAGRPCQVFVLPVRNVIPTFRVSIPLGQPKVNDIHIVLSLAYADEEVVWLDVSVEEQPGVDVLHPLDHLVCQH